MFRFKRLSGGEVVEDDDDEKVINVKALQCKLQNTELLVILH